MNRRIRRVALTTAVAAAAVVFVVTKRSDIPMAAHALRRAQPLWLVLAAGFSAAIVVNLAALQARAQGLFGVRRPNSRWLRLTAGAHFLNLVTKSGGMAGIASFIADSRATDQSVERTTAGYIISEMASHLGLTAALLVAIPVVAEDGKLNVGDLVAIAIFGALTLVSVVGLAAAARSQAAIRRLHALPRRVLNVGARVLGRQPRPEPIDHHAADDLHQAIVLLRRHRRGWWPLVVHALLYPAIGVCLLWVVMQALDLHQGLDVALVVYAIAMVFSIIGFLPAGIGFTEFSMAATLASYGVKAGPAAATVGLYRLFELWIPLTAGALSVRSRRAPSPILVDAVA